jgi:tetratricopeptide (TPR) repeat protein
MNPQDEIKARLEVAQLYEEMGQSPKAARYYLAAAEIALKAKLFDQGKTFLEKVLVLDPENKEARSYLDRLAQHLASQTGSSAPRPVQVENRASGAGLTVPTPSVYLRKDQISAILSQVASAPNPKFFPFSPLPKVDERAIEKKAQMAEARRDEQRAKERTAVESSFSKGPSQFGTGGKSMFSQAVPARRKDPDKGQTAPAEEPRRPRRGANQDLAESIRRRLQGGT